MNTPTSSKGPVLGVLLLIVIGGLVFAGLKFLQGTGDQTPEPPKDNTPVVVDRPDEGGPNVTKSPDTGAAALNNLTGSEFAVMCMGPGGAAEPLAGVEVVATPLQGMNLKRDQAVTVVSDDQGEALFEDLQFANYEVSAEPEGSYRLVTRNIKAGERVNFVFAECMPLDGVVKNENGVPVSGAYVSVFSMLQADVMASRVNAQLRRTQDAAEINVSAERIPYLQMAMTTGADGVFSFPGVPHMQRITLRIQHEEYDNLEKGFFTKDQAPIHEELVLLPRTTIFGQVLDDATGAPMAGVTVSATENGVPIEYVKSLGGEAKQWDSTTDENGQYRLEGLPRGRQYVTVQLDGFDQFIQSWELLDYEPYQLDIRLKKAASLSGRVMDAQGRPVANAAVYWVHPETLIVGNRALENKEPCTTDADGRFRFTNLPTERPLHLIAQHPRYVESRNENVVLLPGDQVTDVNIIMSTGGTIAGSVKTAAERPIQNATITAQQVKGRAMNPVVSGADGTFTIPNTRPGMYTVTCEAPGFVTRVTSNVSETATGVDFFLVREAIFTGALKNKADKPVTRFKLRARLSSTNQVVKELKVENDEGSFELDGLQPGAWDFEFTAPGYAPLVLREEVLREGETTQAEGLAIGQGAELAGKVLGTSGQGVAAALIRLDMVEPFDQGDKTYLHLQTRSDGGGNFTVSRLAPGTYDLIVSHPGYARVPAKKVTIGEDEAVKEKVVLPAPARLVVIVRDSRNSATVSGAAGRLFQGSSPMDSAQVRTKGNLVGIEPGGTDPREGFGSLGDAELRSRGGNIPVDEEGRITWDRKEPGDWTLWVTAPGYQRHTATVTLQGGRETVYIAEMVPLN